MAEEKQQSRQASLTLQVMNGNELESGRAAKCLFSENGGDIGHTPECHWQVQDRAGSIAARACTVIRHDGAYCLRCLTPGLMINLAPASSDALIRLRQGDEIQLGALALKVFLHDGAAVTYDERMATPETIVMNQSGAPPADHRGTTGVSGNAVPASACPHGGARFFQRSAPGTPDGKPDGGR